MAKIHTGGSDGHQTAVAGVLALGAERLVDRSGFATHRREHDPTCSGPRILIAPKPTAERSAEQLSLPNRGAHRSAAAAVLVGSFGAPSPIEWTLREMMVRQRRAEVYLWVKVNAKAQKIRKRWTWVGLAVGAIAFDALLGAVLWL